MNAGAKRLAVLVVAGLLSCLQSTPALPQSDLDAVTVTTLAGSGSMGIADGDTAHATFEIPDGLAAGSDGTIYVADAAAQRIRAISGGRVTTIAGSGAPGVLGFSVVAGYRDGPALEAQFKRPRGIAVAPDGAIFIADSGNATIRKLENGVVTTVVGKPAPPTASVLTALSQSPSSPTPAIPSPPHAVDGDATSGRLVRPMSLAFDATGRLWIADYGGGLRYWEHGILSTVKLAPDSSEALSVSVQPDDGTVLLATRTYVYEYAPKTGKEEEGFPNFGTSDFNGPIGTPNQIVGIGNGQAIFTDDAESNVRYLRFARLPFTFSSYSSVIAGGTFERHSDNMGFADGAGSVARFSLPSGVLVLGDRVIVADSANHRIRAFNLEHFRTPETGRNSQYRYDASHYEVALVGSSWEFFDSHDGDSICAHVEHQLDASGRLSKSARCHTVRIDAGLVAPTEDYISANLAFRHVDEIVLALDPLEALSMDKADLPASAATFHASIASLLTAIRPSKAHLTILWQYFPWTISNREELRDLEVMPQRLGLWDPDTFATIVRPKQLSLFKMLEDLGIGQCDIYDRIVAYEQGPGAPLFLPDNRHPTARGNALLGTVLGDCLAERLPSASR